MARVGEREMERVVWDWDWEGVEGEGDLVDFFGLRRKKERTVEEVEGVEEGAGEEGRPAIVVECGGVWRRVAGPQGASEKLEWSRVRVRNNQERRPRRS